MKKVKKLSFSKPTINAESAKSFAKSRTLRILGSWLLALAVALVLQRFVFQSYQVFGHSMEPTLSEGDYLVISKLSSSWAQLSHGDYLPARGDIVVVDSPLDKTRLVKRVIGLPGERVTVSGGQVKVFSQAQPAGFDPYENLNLPSKYTAGQISAVVPESHVFVVGDNREAGASLDSRNDLGPIPTKNIIGKLIIRLWPPAKIQSF